MKMPPFKLHTPNSLDEALEIARNIQSSGEDFDWIAGGTDLLPNYKWHLNSKKNVISLAKIPTLTELSDTHIGAMVRLQDLAESKTTHPVLAKSANSIASIMIRRSGTVGGNICLDTRCYWLNQTEDWRESIDWCHKCDCGTGADCRVIPNQNTLCVATYQGDIAPTLMVLDAEVHLIGPEGLRIIPLTEFYQLDGMKKNVLKQGEFLLKVTISKESAQRTGSYQKLRVRDSWDFPEAGVAASWMAGDASTLQIATTALESIPRCHPEEVAALLEEGWNGMDSVKALASSIRKSVKPVNNTSLPPRYRKSMVRVLTKRAVEKILE